MSKKNDPVKMKEAAQEHIRKDVEKAFETGVYEPTIKSPSLKAWWSKVKSAQKKFKKAADF